MNDAAPEAANWTTWIPTIGLCISAAALVFNGLSFRAASKSRDAESLFKLGAEIRENEHRLRTAETEADKEARLVELMNFLDVCAAICRRRLFPRWTHDRTSSYLISAIASIERIEGMSVRIRSMLTDSRTFEDLAEFSRVNRAAIEGARSELEELEANEQSATTEVR